ncbi:MULTISPECIES: serine/threonine-protein kinase [unclassified Nocardioides]|uniref:protein kinase domain-containing protein n=1 Tax=unclassified Nocardioides TaxID=2615069 RepID=UPI0000570A62|nr:MULTISPECIES: serine/threonine-protein kinase [unclassified Nocardioides]ABL79573.1 protein kinase [Nocardioides sp. JS614]
MTSTPDQGHGFADAEHRYRLDSRIATGGMGEVWRGTDTTLGRQVAVKLLKNEYADNPSFRTRFETEAQHAASLHHPNIAAVYDFGEAPAADGSGVQRPFLVMELVDGQPLSALLRPGAPMDPDAVRELLAQAADGLAAAHAAGIVHRDVKPANLLVTPDRQVKITDFGIARAAEGIGLTGTGEVMGTPQYLSPEQAQGQTATPASDVYSLGVVAFECLAGRRPFVADTAVATALAHLREPVPPLPESVPADLAAVVRRALAKLPQDRFADGAALAAALRDPATAVTELGPPVEHDHTRVLPGVAGVLPAEPTPLPGPVAGHVPDPPRVRRRNALWPVLAVLALVAVAVIVVLLVAEGIGSDGPTDEPTRSPQQSRSTQPTSEPPSSQPTSPLPSSEPTSAPPSSEPTSAPPSSEPTSATPTPTPTPTATDSGAPVAPSQSATGAAASEPAAPDSSASRPVAGPGGPSTSPSTSSQGEVDRR